jgi:hypothetical protein
MEILLAITRCRVNQFVRAPHNLVGPDLQAASQLDRFLAVCPITSRYNVIPAAYNGRVHADLSHNFPLTKPLHRCGAYRQGRTYGKQNQSTEARTIFEVAEIRPCRELFRPIVSWAPRHCDTVSAAKGLTK